MTQSDVLKVLKKRNKWMSVKEIAKELRVENGSVIRALNSMFKYGEVFKRKAKKNSYWGHEWKTKELSNSQTEMRNF